MTGDDCNLKKFKKMLFVSTVGALSSQVNIGINSTDFRVSAGIIFFALFLFHNEELKPVQTAVFSGLMVTFFRMISHFLINGSLSGVILSYQIETLFYTFYGIIYMLLTKKYKKKSVNSIFFIMVASDFGANLIELFIRTKIDSSMFPVKIVSTLILVAVIRSSISWIVLILIKHYGMLLVKEEHEERYKRLLWLTSQLKTEMYWMEKNTENIEKIMSKSYKLFEIINDKKDSEIWGDMALDIARDVHEIKKENSLAIRGIKEITKNELKDVGMNFKEIVNILFEAMKREIKEANKHIELSFHTDYNFYTSKHYYLMSMFRNLIMNGIDAIPDTNQEGSICIDHRTDENMHIFEVYDNGIGVDEEGLKHIFSPGFSTKINYETGEINRGLGLSIVKKIVEEEFVGKVSVSSVQGERTVFHISIPRACLEGEEL